MAICYISLGSNQGNKQEYLKRALKALTEVDGVELKRASSIYRTLPWGNEDQDWFLNQVLEIFTVLSPEGLLKKCLEIEDRLGRVRLIQWGPRTIDIDILLYDQIKVVQEDLIIPHPRMLQRAFVLVPLAEIAPLLFIEGRSIRAHLANLPQEEVEGVQIC